MADPAGTAPQLLCLGELLVDMVPLEEGLSLEEARTYLWAAGGAPANVAVAAARLGSRSAVAAAVGDDPFGRALAAELRSAGVDTTHVVPAPRATAVAFVSLSAGGERSFAFYGNDPAHYHLTEEHALAAVERLAGADGTRCLHFGSVCLAREPARSATRAAVAAAREAGCLVSCDVNLREAFWGDLDEARAVIGEFAGMADLVKASEEEARFLAPEAGERGLAERLLGGSARIVVVSRGARGATAFTRSFAATAPAPQVDSVDATGAGDALTGALLASTVLAPDVWYDEAAARAALQRACAYAALSTTRRGAIPSYPTAEELAAFLG